MKRKHMSKKSVEFNQKIASDQPSSRQLLLNRAPKSKGDGNKSKGELSPEQRQALANRFKIAQNRPPGLWRLEHPRMHSQAYLDRLASVLGGNKQVSAGDSD